MEPTGHYWLKLAYYLKDLSLKVVVVNPLKVKRSKEMDDDSPTKNDTKDAKLIAQLIKGLVQRTDTTRRTIRWITRRYEDTWHNSGRFIIDQSSNIICWIATSLNSLPYSKNWTGCSALHLLTEGYFSNDISNTSEDVLLEELNKVTKRSVGMKRIRALKVATENSVGMRAGLMIARQEMVYLMN